MSGEGMAVLAFLGVSLLFYALFAGADFGAGILEAVPGGKRRDDQRRLISRAIAPVWEANHVWLILAVVILMVGFPAVYVAVSTYLHLPLLAVLAGIVARGCAFTFRHYDAPEAGYGRAYTVVFAASSVWTSFFLGVVAGAALLGGIDPRGADFPSLYVAPWLNAFCAALGAFTAALFGFLAAVYLVGEADEPALRDVFARKASAFAVASVALGAAVFVLGERQGLGWFARFLAHPMSIGAFVLASALWLPFRVSLRRPGRTVQARGLAALIVGLVLFGGFAAQYPYAVRFREAGITFMEAAAPPATLRALLWALVTGAAIIFPALGYLFRVFKWETLDGERGSRDVK